jgi:hypothetical protein
MEHTRTRAGGTVDSTDRRIIGGELPRPQAGKPFAEPNQKLDRKGGNLEGSWRRRKKV